MTEKPDAAAIGESVFVDATDQVDRLLADPMVKELIASGREAHVEMNRGYAMNLAALRKAEELTQMELAKRRGVEQATEPYSERHDHTLLSTFASCLTAAGADSVAIVVTVHGREYTFELGSARTEPAA